MTTIRQSKLAAHAGNHWDHKEAETGSGGWSPRSSKRYAKRVTNRKVRHTLKAELQRSAMQEVDEILEGQREASKDFAKFLQECGIGVNCVFIRNGKVVIP